MWLSVRQNLLLRNKKTFCGKMAILGNENRKILCFNLVWVFGIQFALRTEQEHRNVELEKFCLGWYVSLTSGGPWTTTMDYRNGLPK